jgi:hypothetical protein
MASNFNDTTPAAPAGSANVKWQTDGAGNDSAYYGLGLGNGVLVKTGSYAVAAGDAGKLIQMNSAAATTLTLLNPAPASTWQIVVKNIGTGILTISRNGLTIDGKSTDMNLWQGDAVVIYSDGTNYETGSPRVFDVTVFSPGLGSNAQVLAKFIPTRTCIFPAGAPKSTGAATANATANTVYTFKKNGTSFATIQFNAGGVTYTWTQAADASFNGTTDIFELDGPATADTTLTDVGITLQGYRF